MTDKNEKQPFTVPTRLTFEASAQLDKHTKQFYNEAIRERLETQHKPITFFSKQMARISLSEFDTAYEKDSIARDKFELSIGEVHKEIFHISPTIHRIHFMGQGLRLDLELILSGKQESHILRPPLYEKPPSERMGAFALFRSEYLVDSEAIREAHYALQNVARMNQYEDMANPAFYLTNVEYKQMKPHLQEVISLPIGQAEERHDEDEQAS